METFGLGLVLSFTDNASSGMLRAANNLAHLEGMANTTGGSLMTLEQQMNNLAIAGANLVIVGDQITNLGVAMVGSLGSILKGVISTGAEFESFRITLNALYKDEEKVAEQMANLMRFSATTPFEVADTKDLLVTLKSQGIEAFDQMEGAATGARQATLAWLGDLMTFKPEVPVSRWKLAIQNFLGSGESKVLRNVLDMGDIETILQHGLGNTPLERFKDLIELIEKKNLTGLMEKNMGTFNQMLSNVADQFTMLQLEIGDTIVGTMELENKVTGLKETVDAKLFDELKMSLKGLTSVMLDIDEVAGKGTFKKFTTSIAEGLHALTAPLVTLSEKLGAFLGEFIVFVGNHPEITKMIMAFTALAGAGLVAFGTLLKFSGSIYMLTAGIRNLSFLLPSLANGFAIFPKLLLGAAASALPFILISALAYTAWHKNLLGIQQAAADAAGILTRCFRTIKMSFDGYLTSTEYHFVQRWGLLELASAVNSLKHALGELFRGVGEGFNSILLDIQKYFPELTFVGKTLKETIINISRFISEITAYKYKDDYRKVGQAIGRIGTYIIIAIPLIKALGVAFTIAKAPLAPFIAAIAALTAGFIYLKDHIKDSEGNLTSLGEKVKNVLGTIGSVLDKFLSTKGGTGFKDLFESFVIDPTQIEDKITTAISQIDTTKLKGVLAATLLLIFKPEAFAGIASSIGKGVATTFSGLNIGDNLRAIGNIDVSDIFGGAVVGVSKVKGTVTATGKEISGIFSRFRTEFAPEGAAIKTALINTGTKIKTGFLDFGSTFKSGLPGLKQDFKEVADIFTPQWLKDEASMFGSAMKDAGKFLKDGFTGMGESAVNAGKFLGDKLGVLKDFAGSKFDTVKTFIGEKASSAFGKVSDVFGKSKQVLGVGIGKAKEALAPVGTMFEKVGNVMGPTFSKIGDKVKGGVAGLGGKLGGIGEKIMGALGPIGNGFTTAIGGIVSAIGGWPVLLVAAIIAAIAVFASLLSQGDAEEGKKKVADFFCGLWDMVPEEIQEPLKKIWGVVEGWIDEVAKKMGFEDGMTALTGWVDDVWDKFVKLGDDIRAAIQPVIDWVKEAWDGWLGDLVTNIVTFAGNVIDLVMVFVGMVIKGFQMLWPFIEPVLNFIGEGLNNLMTIINGLIDFIVGVFTGDWDRAWKGISEIFDGIWGNIKLYFETVVNIVIDIANLFIKYIVNGLLGLVSSIANGIADGLNAVLDFFGIDFELGHITLEVPPIPHVQLATGGYVKNEGMAYLHPNEVVINDPLTQSLRSFLENSEKNQDIPVSSIINNTNTNTSNISYDTIANTIEIPSSLGTASTTQNNSQTDNSVVFNQGSIVIQVQNANSQAEVESLATKIMQLIERKQALRAMAIRG